MAGGLCRQVLKALSLPIAVFCAGMRYLPALGGYQVGNYFFSTILGVIFVAIYREQVAVERAV